MKLDKTSRGALLLASVAVLAVLTVGAKGEGHFSVLGGGTTMIGGGNLSTQLDDLTPAITRFAIRAVKPKGGVADGRFECVALVPESTEGPGSGVFTQNIMHVAGFVTGLEKLDGDTAQITGQGMCTGLGEGENVNWVATVSRGGVGVGYMELTVDTLPGILFQEVVTEGEILFSKKKVTNP